MHHLLRQCPAPCLALLLLLALTACGEGGVGELRPPSSAAPPVGSAVVTCELDTGDASISFAFALAQDYSPDPAPGGTRCGWRRPAPPRAENPPGNPVGDPTVDSVVVVEWIGETESLSDVRDFNEPYVSEDGDDALSDLRLSEDVAVFGETIGDRLRWDCFCDGVPNVTYLAQADGVRLTWSGSSVLQDQIEDEVRTALASAGAG